MGQRGSQTLVFGWLAHPESSLEQLASTAAIREVLVSDTAIHKRFTEPCAHFLHAVLQEPTAIVVQADQEVPVPLLHTASAMSSLRRAVALPCLMNWRNSGKGVQDMVTKDKLLSKSISAQKSSVDRCGDQA